MNALTSRFLFRLSGLAMPLWRPAGLFVLPLALPSAADEVEGSFLRDKMGEDTFLKAIVSRDLEHKETDGDRDAAAKDFRQSMAEGQTNEYEYQFAAGELKALKK